MDDGLPLVVAKLARPAADGLLGLWTYLPACFGGLRVSTCDGAPIPGGEMPHLPQGAIEAWSGGDYGAVTCEPNGTLNLSRYLPASLGEARLIRRFEMQGPAIDL